MSAGSDLYAPPAARCQDDPRDRDEPWRSCRFATAVYLATPIVTASAYPLLEGFGPELRANWVATGVVLTALAGLRLSSALGRLFVRRGLGFGLVAMIGSGLTLGAFGLLLVPLAWREERRQRALEAAFEQALAAELAARGTEPSSP